MINTVAKVHGDFVMEYGIKDFPLFHHVCGIIATESQWNAEADSGYQRGLMQVSPQALRTVNFLYQTSYTYDDMFDPAKNVFVGIRYMRWLYRYFKNIQNLDTELAIPYSILAYNWGIGNVVKWFKYTQKSNSFIDEAVPEETKSHLIDWLFWSGYYTVISEVM